MRQKIAHLSSSARGANSTSSTPSCPHLEQALAQNLEPALGFEEQLSFAFDDAGAGHGYLLSLFSKGVWMVPIGGLAGLVGLGGGEFRLPVLMHVVGYPARTAVPRNLAVSLVTLAFALVVRSGAVPVGELLPYLNEVAGLTVGGVASALYGARFVSAIKSEHLIKTIAALLAALGALVLFEVAYPFQYTQVIPAGVAIHFGAGFCLGIIIGLVSSILGVAGGELLIPTMMFVFGADIKTAGTASLVISVCVVTSGLWRYWRFDAIETRLDARRIVSAMSAGSLIGAALGGIAVGFAPVGAINILGVIVVAPLPGRARREGALEDQLAHILRLRGASKPPSEEPKSKTRRGLSRRELQAIQ